ncbi:MAG: polymorphic toxin type 50 domain-containing protein [Bacteroidota bacterium]
MGSEFVTDFYKGAFDAAADYLLGEFDHYKSTAVDTINFIKDKPVAAYLSSIVMPGIGPVIGSQVDAIVSDPPTLDDLKNEVAMIFGGMHQLASMVGSGNPRLQGYATTFIAIAVGSALLTRKVSPAVARYSRFLTVQRNAGKLGLSAKRLSRQKQNRHVFGTNEFKQRVKDGKNPSAFDKYSDAQKVLDETFAGRGTDLVFSTQKSKIGIYVTVDKVVGKYRDPSGKYQSTNRFFIQGNPSKGEAKIYPVPPKP